MLAPRAGPHARVAFLAPTFTYQAYGNHALGWTNDAMRQRMADWGAYPYTPDDYPIYGHCTYNLHPDGAGVAFASRLRPLLTVRPGYLTFTDKAARAFATTLRSRICWPGSRRAASIST